MKKIILLPLTILAFCTFSCKQSAGGSDGSDSAKMDSAQALKPSRLEGPNTLTNDAFSLSIPQGWFAEDMLEDYCCLLEANAPLPTDSVAAQFGYQIDVYSDHLNSVAEAISLARVAFGDGSYQAADVVIDADTFKCVRCGNDSDFAFSLIKPVGKGVVRVVSHNYSIDHPALQAIVKSVKSKLEK